MPSVPTVRRTLANGSRLPVRIVAPPSRVRRLSASQLIGRLLLLAAAAGLLTSCITGEASDARRAQERAATKGAVLPGVEATSIAQRFRPPTATPAPPPTPRPAIASLVLTTNPGPDGAPQSTIRGASDGGTIYAAAQLSHLSAGQTVTAVWTNSAGGELSRSNVTIKADADEQWVDLQWVLDGSLPSGLYAVYIYVGDQLMNSLSFPIN